MKRGPKPKPAELKELTGNPGKRPLPDVSILPAGEVGDPPAELDDRAKDKWASMAQEFFAVLRATDRDALGIYCMAWSEMMLARAKIEESDGWLFAAPNGEIKKNPWVVILEQRREFCRKMLAEFGASPSARARLAAEGKPEVPTSKFAGLLGAQNESLPS
ncbi:MAG: phage terminase small subunit P27 family [Pseudomonadota bacterium]